MGDVWLDQIAASVGYVTDPDDPLLGAQDVWTPDVPTWAVLRTTGATLNEYDEPVGGTTTATLLYAAQVPLGKKLQELIGGDWSGQEVILRVQGAPVLVGERLRPEPDDGTRYKVAALHAPSVGGATICQNLKLVRQHTEG